jgi:hypothetical protein
LWVTCGRELNHNFVDMSYFYLVLRTRAFTGSSFYLYSLIAASVFYSISLSRETNPGNILCLVLVPQVYKTLLLLFVLILFELFKGKHILIGADEGIYSLNISEPAPDIEMEQV